MATPMLKAEDVENAMELIAHGEFGVALELICDQLHEYEVEVPEDLLREIEIAGVKMEISESLWEWMKVEGER